MTLALFLASLTFCPVAATADGDARRGEKLFARCSACHSENGQKKIGPSLAGVVGRKAGSLDGVRYSNALKQSNLVWTDESLNAFLTAPARLVPGTTMTVRISNEQDRQDLISYMKSLN